MYKNLSLIIAGILMGIAGLLFVVMVDRDMPPDAALERNNFFLQIKEEWRATMQAGEMQEVYVSLLQRLPTIHEETHTSMHIIGELLFEEGEMDGLSVCTFDYGFGCYHGFFNAAIHKEGIGVLPYLDAACKEAFGLVDTRCQHGLGHGLLVYTGYENLEDALELCRTIDQERRSGCASGVFMEYSFHEMEKPGEGYYRELPDISRAYEPCVSVSEWFRQSCYQEQSSWWWKVFNEDWEMIGALCEQIPHLDQKTACFQGVGILVTEIHGYDYDAVVKQCEIYTSTHVAQWCVHGASWRFIGRKEDEDEYHRLCDLLSPELQLDCESKFDAW